MGKCAVTGAASGIGEAVVQRLTADGHEVMTLDIRNADFNGDLSDPEQVQAAVAAIKAWAPEGLDGFVPCAGLGPDFPDLTKVPLVNYFAVVDMVQGLRESLEAKRGGVVLISSNSARMTPYSDQYMDTLLNHEREQAIAIAKEEEGQQLYGGGKQALARWMRRVNSEYAAAGVRLNAIAPGFTDSAMTRSGMEHPEFGPAMRDFVNSIPLGRPGQPEDQANAVSFLLSDQASFISGSVLFIDGGHDAVFRPDEF